MNAKKREPSPGRRRSRVGRGAARRRERGVRADEAARDEEVLRQKILRGRDNEGAPPETPSSTELTGATRAGSVVALRGAVVSVQSSAADETVPCVLRKSTRVPHSRANAVAVGDEVSYLAQGDPPFVLTEVEPRRTWLGRSRRGREEQVICANVDQAVVVASAGCPPFKPRLVDRYLISAGQGGLRPLLVLNKTDLVGAGEPEALLEPYRSLGLVTVACSALTGEGFTELENVLRGSLSVLVGQSGVGKSSLLNRLIPGLALRIAEVYGSLGKGRHTTSTSTMYSFPFGGAVVDTPGIRSFSLHEPTAEVVASFFPEIVAAAAACRFADCRHRGDQGCAMPRAIAQRRVRPDRLESFLLLMDEVVE
jgi:ribosome biogenesis GTPase